MLWSNIAGITGFVGLIRCQCCKRPHFQTSTLTFSVLSRTNGHLPPWHGGTQHFGVGMPGAERRNGVGDRKNWYFSWKIRSGTESLQHFEGLWTEIWAKLGCRTDNSLILLKNKIEKFLSQESKLIIFAQSGGLKNWIMVQLKNGGRGVKTARHTRTIF